MDQDKKITVLFIIKPERSAGAEMVLVEAAARLNPDRFRVICGLLTPDVENVIPAHLPSVDFRMPGLNGWVWLRFILQLCWVIYRRRVDLLHVNSYVPGNYARLAAALMQVPIIIDHWHGFTRFSRKRRFICRVLGRFTDLSLAVSRGVRDYLVAQGGLDPAKVRVVANGVDVAAIEAARPGNAVRRELGLPEGVPVIGLVGRLDHWGKGHKELFEAMAPLMERHPVQALIVGGGRRMDEVRALAESLGLAGAVHFLGERHDVPDLLNAMDIFVLPSYSEGLSLALLGGHGGRQAGDRHRGGGHPGSGDGGRQRFIDPAPGRRGPGRGPGAAADGPRPGPAPGSQRPGPRPGTLLPGPPGPGDQ